MALSKVGELRLVHIMFVADYIVSNAKKKCPFIDTITKFYVSSVMK